MVAFDMSVIFSGIVSRRTVS
ncbi:hypothetical protein CCACVL1_02388, partial [Corchorus capsularis]